MPEKTDEVHIAAERLEKHMEECPKCGHSIFMCLLGYEMLNDLHRTLYFAVVNSRLGPN